MFHVGDVYRQSDVGDSACFVGVFGTEFFRGRFLVRTNRIFVFRLSVAVTLLLVYHF